ISDVLHIDPALEPGADRLGECLLRRKALGQRPAARLRARRSLGLLDLGEHASEELVAPAIERTLDPLNVAQVRSDADDHASLLPASAARGEGDRATKIAWWRGLAPN